MTREKIARELSGLADEIKTAQYQDKGTEKARASACLTRLMELKELYDAVEERGE